MKKLLFFFLLAFLILGVANATITYTAINQKTVGEATLSSRLTSGTAISDGITGLNYASWPDNYRLVILFNVTSLRDYANESPHFTVKAGDNPPAFRSSLGDLNLSITALGSYFMGPLESARFQNVSGYLNCFGTNITAGTVSLLKVS